ncbi:hypothetical protein DBT_2184 [Dissulfuribacter thermophilus]|uniref:BFN domain-containing protein n=1 Tax=Dissulfuribacter thermophilus TaxID=1156395 RepID=A0A1B9F3Q5_9BACT|nr:bifunctional nuclease family protein [Dissulfuribacter thermophilus]OCC14455.1 hypothetical protein DBT_2184 [Dissulfuribacter thermophilus]
MNFLQVKVHAITMDPDSNSPVLILKESQGERSLPIWIGLLEATAIATEMEKISFVRPMTHDLTVNLLEAVGVQVTRVAVTDLKDNTFYAVITLKNGDEEVEVDARPSDAIAIALRTGAQIFVSEEVMNSAVPQEPTTIYEEDVPKEKKKWAELLEELDPQSLKYKM